MTPYWDRKQHTVNEKGQFRRRRMSVFVAFYQTKKSYLGLI